MNNFKTKFNLTICSIFFGIWIALIIFFNPLKVCAEGNTFYPYIISDYSDTYTSFANNNPDLISFFLNNSDVSNYISGHDYILYFPDVTSWRESSTITVLVDPVVSAVPSLSESTSFTNTSFQVSGYTFSLGIYVDNGSYQVSSTSFYEPSTVTFFGNTSEDTFTGVNGFNNGSYFVNYPFYSTIDLSFGDNLLLSMGSGSNDPIISGSVIAPIFTGLTGADLASGVSSVPSLPSTPSYTPPSFDNSSITSALQSLFDIIDYNLTYSTNRISDLVNYLSSVIQYGFKSLIDNIQNGIQNLFDNFQSLFEPLLNNISQKIDYVTEPVDQSAIQSAFEDTDIYNIYASTITFMEDFQEVFDIPEPDEFIIAIHLENLTFFNPRLSTYYLNLGDSFIPIRTALRIFLWCIVSFGSIFYVEKNFPGWLMGDD